VISAGEPKDALPVEPVPAAPPQLV